MIDDLHEIVEAFSNHDQYMSKKRPSLSLDEQDDWILLRAFIERAIRRQMTTNQVLVHLCETPFPPNGPEAA